jgi:hypothetical protein
VVQKVDHVERTAKVAWYNAVVPSRRSPAASEDWEGYDDPDDRTEHIFAELNKELVEEKAVEEWSVYDLSLDSNLERLGLGTLVTKATVPRPGAPLRLVSFLASSARSDLVIMRPSPCHNVMHTENKSLGDKWNESPHLAREAQEMLQIRRIFRPIHKFFGFFISIDFYCAKSPHARTRSLTAG